jgi:hypothetical protein
MKWHKYAIFIIVFLGYSMVTYGNSHMMPIANSIMLMGVKNGQMAMYDLQLDL